MTDVPDLGFGGTHDCILTFCANVQRAARAEMLDHKTCNEGEAHVASMVAHLEATLKDIKLAKLVADLRRIFAKRAAVVDLAEVRDGRRR